MFKKTSTAGIEYFTSSILQCPSLAHAFSTRIGGNTPKPLDTFSMGDGGSGLFTEYIEANRQKLCEILELDYKKLLVPQQKHTSNIAVVKSQKEVDLSQTDGVITNQVDLPIMLLFADCTPIVLYSEQDKVLGVIHAGWRGTADKICKKAVDIFVKEFGVLPSNIKAAIGPAIGQCCYPVSEEVALKLKNSVENNYDNIFKSNNEIDKIKVDLKQLNAMQLKEAGVVNIDIMGYCTSCQNSLFYSYRSDNGKTGRHCVLASIKD